MQRVVLITGASSGIGAAAARELVDRGYRVFGTSRDPDRLPPDAPSVDWIPMDVRDDASVQSGVDALYAAAARLDAVVCNAGFGTFGSVEDLPLEVARDQFETNWFGVLRTLRAALPLLRRSRDGRIVLVGSLAAQAPIPFQAHYSASKAAVEALALALHNELWESDVRVSLVTPGDIHTPFNDALRFDHGSPPDSAYREAAARCREVVEHSLEDAPGPEVVARSIHRALSARRPRIRYSVGPDSWLVPVGRRLLPDRLALYLIRRHFRV